MEAAKACLYSPTTAIRVDNDTFLGTPIPPEEPAAESAPNGAIIDYYLKGTAERVTLEIVDSEGKVVRAFSSDSPKETKHPPVAIAERWFPKPQVVETTRGMHRFVWDLSWSPIKSEPEARDDDEEYGAPHAPRVLPGTYEVRLAVDGVSMTQPLKVVMDPRSAATPAELEQQYQLGRQMFTEVMAIRQTLAEIRSVKARLTTVGQKLSTQQTDLKTGINQVEDAIKQILSGKGVRSGDVMGLELASGSIAGALRVVESGDRTIPAQAIAVFEEADRAAKMRMDEWARIKTARLRSLSEQLKRANEGSVSPDED